MYRYNKRTSVSTPPNNSILPMNENMQYVPTYLPMNDSKTQNKNKTTTKAYRRLLLW